MHDQTLWDLVTTERISIDSLVAAVDAYLANPETRTHRLSSAYTIDLAAAVEAHLKTSGDEGDAEIDEPARRTAVRSALLLAKPIRRDRREP